MGTAWAGGFVTGCFFAPRLVRRAGHVRAFGAFAASGAIVALLTGLIIDEYVWILLRAFTGFTMAGAFMVIESWLNEKATNENRGTVFGLYMMVTYASIMAGQMIVAAGDVGTASLFMVTGIFFCLSLHPDRRFDRRHAQAAAGRLARHQGPLRQFAGRLGRLPAHRRRQRRLGHARRRLRRAHRHLDRRDRADDEPRRRRRRGHAAAGRPPLRQDRPPLRAGRRAAFGAASSAC